MSVLREQDRREKGDELARLKAEMEQHADDVIARVQGREQTLAAIKAYMQQHDDVYDAADIADVESVEAFQASEIQRVVTTLGLGD